jgi:hypothetical protein
VTTIQLRRGSAAAASKDNPVLAAGELGVETDTGKFKIGDGSTAWNSLPYATDLSRLPASVDLLGSAGDPRLRRATSPYLRGQVAVTRCGQPRGTNSLSAAAFTGRVAYTTGPTATADLRCCFSNWISVAGSASEGTPGQSATIKAAIELTQSSGPGSFPLWFGGSRVGTLVDGGEIWSDPVGIELPAGTTFYIRVLYTPGTVTGGGSTGTVYPEANIYSTNADSWVAGDAVDGTGALANSPASGIGLYRPTAITGTPVGRVPQVLIIGDERAMGNNDAPSYAGYINAALAGGSFVTVNLGADQDSAAGFATGHGYRGRLIAGCDYAIETYGGKDLDASDSLAAIQASRIAIWELCNQRSVAVYADTIPPYTTSTDSWTTTTHQTHAWPAGEETVRVQMNQWIRAGAPIAGGVAVTPGATGAHVAGDGDHPLAGVIDDAAKVETQVYQHGQGTDSGIWQVGSGGVALTGNGYAMNAAGCVLAAQSVPIAALV